jgi:hypothetical protein
MGKSSSQTDLLITCIFSTHTPANQFTLDNPDNKKPLGLNGLGAVFL